MFQLKKKNYNFFFVIILIKTYQSDWIIDRTPGLYESAIEIRKTDIESDVNESGRYDKDYLFYETMFKI